MPPIPPPDPTPLPDFRQDPAAFRAFYERYKARVFNTVLGYVQRRPEAEELTQDVFVEIHQSARRFAGQSAVATWVYRIAVNKALDFLRHQKRQKRFAALRSLFWGETGEPVHDPPDFDHPGVVLPSFSVMPWADSVARLREYAREHGVQDGKWHLLTGPKAAIYTLAQRAYFAEETPGFTRDSTQLLHTEHLVLVDRTGRLRGLYKGTQALDTERLVDDIRALLEE